jgi:hypothetical protein
MTETIIRIKYLWHRYEHFLPLILLFGGILSVIFFANGFEYIRWVLLYLFGIWLLILLTITILRRVTQPERNGWQRLQRFVEFLIQNMFEETFIFLIPFYYFSTTLDSINIWFFLLMLGMAISANVDAIYERFILKYKPLMYVYYGFCVFTCLNFVLPVLLGIRNIYSLYFSSAISLVLILPLYFQFSAMRSKSFLRGAGIALGAVWIVLTWCRIAIPPAPLKLVQGAVSSAYDKTTREPRQEFTTITQEQLLAGIYCHTAIFAPHGIQEELLHVWSMDGVTIDEIYLAEINGGRDEGYRTRSFKQVFPPNPVGNWTVDAMTAGGQLIGRTRFVVEK